MKTYKYYSLLSEADYAQYIKQDFTVKNCITISIRTEDGEYLSESVVEWNNGIITIEHCKDDVGLVQKYQDIFNIPNNINPENYCVILRQHGFMNENTKLICPICRHEYKISHFRDSKYGICPNCRRLINLCNLKNKTTCFKCVDEFIQLIYVKLDDIHDPSKYKVKSRKSYGCFEGSRLVKHCKKYKIDETDMVKYLRWGVDGKILLPVEKCWVAKKGGNKSYIPLFGVAGNKITCLNYCIYGQEGKLSCPYWRGKR